MKGKWKGTYWFSGDVPEDLKNRITDFELTIERHSRGKIYGKISDSLETEATKGIGRISGKIKGTTVQFKKKMPIRTYYTPDGTRMEVDKPHRPIYYKGVLDVATNLIKGT